MHTESWLDLAEKLCVIIPVLWGVTWAVFSRLYKRWKMMLITAIQEQLKIQNDGIVTLLKAVTPNGGNTNSLGDWVVRLARKTDDQTKILEHHTEQLNTLTGVASGTKNHLDRKILHESADPPLAGTSLANEVSKELGPNTIGG